VVLPGGRVEAGESLVWNIVGDGWRLPGHGGGPPTSAEQSAPAASALVTVGSPPVPPARLARSARRTRARPEPPAAILAQPVVQEAGFGPRTRVTLLRGGSDRRFWRLRDRKRAAVLVEVDPRDPELRNWLAIGVWLWAEKLGGPGFFADDAERGAVLMEDLGDLTLEMLANDSDDARELLYEIYDEVVARLVDLQVRGTAALERCPAAGRRRFGYEDLRWETGYFRRRFLSAMAEVPGGTLAGLEEDFHRLALAVLEQPEVLMHRDFQSRNILLHDFEPRFVDFGGMRLGPLAYDLASLLRDPYVRLTPALRASMRDSYRVQLAEAGGPSLTLPEMERLEVLAGLQRVMQAIGAYAHLGLVRGKREFLRHVPAGLARLAELLEEWRDLRALGRQAGPAPDLEALSALVRELRRRDPSAWRRGEVR
jgi:N-acetylmuramate 1-kinase